MVFVFNKTYKKIVCILFFILLFLQVHAQPKYKAKIHKYTNDTTFTIASKKFKTNAQISDYCNKLLKSSKNKGFIASSIDSVYTYQNETNVIFRMANKYYLKTIHVFDEKNTPLLKYTKSYRNKKLYSIDKIENIKRKIVNNSQNKGFPFPSINSKTRIDNNKLISHYFKINSGTKFTYKSIKISNVQRPELNYISNITKIKEGEFYKKKDVDNLKAAIINTGIYAIDSINLEYFQNELEITPFIKTLKQNSISALMGIQTNENDKTSITGNAELHTKNILKVGDQFDFDWRKNNTESQLLNISIKFPYIYNAPIGIITELGLDKRDSSFTKQSIKIGITIPITHKSEISTHYTSINNTLYENSNNSSTAKQSLYGLSLKYYNVNNIRIPKKGVIATINLMSGNRRYNELENDFILKNNTDINLYFKFLSGSIKLRTLFGYIANDSIKQNELFQLGGTKTIRGFNENSIFSKNFNISSVEYRIFIAANSHASLFYDFGTFYNNYQKNEHTYRQAIGAGLTIDTKSGILSIVYALGKQNQEAINISNAKVHIGYTATF